MSQKKRKNEGTKREEKRRRLRKRNENKLNEINGILLYKLEK